MNGDGRGSRNLFGQILFCEWECLGSGKGSVFFKFFGWWGRVDLVFFLFYCFRRMGRGKRQKIQVIEGWQLGGRMGGVGKILLVWGDVLGLGSDFSF